MNTIRAFIAIEVPDEVKRTVTAVSGQLDKIVPTGSVRWVKPNALHLTLRFLGDTEDRLILEIGQMLDNAVGRLPHLSLRPGRLGVFPNPKQPRVLWLSLEPITPTTTATLADLKTAIDRTIEPVGFAADKKPFTPHLTLGRVRDGRSIGEVPWAMSVPTAAFVVTAVHLIQSDLRPDGPHYTTLHTTTLAGTP